MRGRRRRPRPHGTGLALASLALASTKRVQHPARCHVDLCAGSMTNQCVETGAFSFAPKVQVGTYYCTPSVLRSADVPWGQLVPSIGAKAGLRANIMVG